MADLLMQCWCFVALLGLRVVASGAAAGDPLDALETYKVQNVELLKRIEDLQNRLEECQQACGRQTPAVDVGFQETGEGTTGESEESERRLEELEGVGTPDFDVHLLESFGLVCLAAIAAGLTIGLVSLETMDLELIMKTNEMDMSDREKLKLRADQAAAEHVLPILKDHHRLLVTLLLMNSLANEALPLCLGKICPEWLAVIFSMSLVLVFGEIVPSAIFTGPNQLTFASNFVMLVKIFMFLTTPISVPIARLLDTVLGSEHKGRYNFAQMRAIVKMHRNVQGSDKKSAVFKSIEHEGLGIVTTQDAHGFGEEDQVLFEGVSTVLELNKRYFVHPCPPPKGRDLKRCLKLYTGKAKTQTDQVIMRPGDIAEGVFIQEELDEYKIMHGVMDLTHMEAGDAKRKLSQVYMLEKNTLLTHDKLKEILESGYSRIPVYDEYKHNVRWFVLVKKMITVSPSDWSPQTIQDLPKESLICVSHRIHMLDLLNEFQEKKCHLAILADAPEIVKDSWEKDHPIPVDVHMMGIITLEDVIEKMLQEEIYDEVDRMPESLPYRSKSRSFTKKFTSVQPDDMEQRAITLPLLSHQHWS